MKARGVWAVLLLAASAAAHAGTWTDWWWTPDQQAQHALDSGDAKRAAQLFTDPHRRAYAEVQAGDYTAAAKNLAPFKDAESQYNRGNALAHAGDLQAALDAYDAVLKQAAADSSLQHDARHNRDLVAEQLKKQKRQPNRSSKSGQGENRDRSSESKSASSDSKSNQPNASQQSGSSQSQSNKSEPGKSEPSKSGPSQSAQNADDTNGKKESEQAQRDAAEGAKQMQAQRQSQQGDDRLAANAARSADKSDGQKAQAAAPPKPPSEQTMALDQWLRQIPDDPGGLLRRKFLIEHMLKQRESQE